MDIEIPVCIIFLDGCDVISGYNRFFKDEISKYNIKDTLQGNSIKDYIHDFSRDMVRKKSVISIKNILITCVASYSNSSVFIEPMLYNKSFIRFIGHEIKTLVHASVDLLGLLSRIPATNEQKRYIDPMRNNNIELLRTMNNTVDYLKVSSGLLLSSEEEFPISRAIADIKKVLLGYKIDYDISLERDIILSTDYDKFIQLVTHILMDSVESLKNKKLNIQTSLYKDLFTISFTVPGHRLSKYQRDTIFEGFIHNDTKTDHKSLYMPIARGISRLIGGDLILSNNTIKGTVYSFSIKTKDIDSE